MDADHRVAPFEAVAEKEFKATPEVVHDAPKKSFLPDPRILFAKHSAGRTHHEYLTDEAVFSQGDPADAVYYIESGKVRFTVKSAEGEQAVISVLAEGSFFGECCLAGQPVRSATASALVPSSIVRIELQVMMDLIRRDPEFAERFLTHTLSRSICIEADLVSHLFRSSEKRLARMQGLMAKFGAEWKPIPATAKLSPESMAEIIGTTSSKVSFLLDEFRELGFIDSSGDEMLVHGSLKSIASNDDGAC